MEEQPLAVIAHYRQAEVEGKLYKLGDCVHVHVSFFLILSLLSLGVNLIVKGIPSPPTFMHHPYIHHDTLLMCIVIEE